MQNLTMRFLDACLGRPVDTTPVWLMRQAGRYLPEYRALREKASFYEMCSTPALIVEATLQPMRRFDLDAAIIFSDILLPFMAMGIKVEFSPEPKILEHVRSREDASRVRPFDPLKETDFLLEAIAKVRGLLPSEKGLLGFAGAPFTLATYLIEGGGSRDLFFTKRWMLSDPVGFSDLLFRIADAIAPYLEAQIMAGADAVQLFDTWAGALSPGDFRRFALPAAKAVLQRLARKDKGLIYFVKGAAAILEDLKGLGVDCLSLDFCIDLSEAIGCLGQGVSVQGNLDPMVLFAPEEELRKRVKEIVLGGLAARGHIFNLGHGIHKETPVEAVTILVDEVHKSGRRV